MRHGRVWALPTVFFNSFYLSWCCHSPTLTLALLAAAFCLHLSSVLGRREPFHCPRKFLGLPAEDRVSEIHLLVQPGLALASASASASTSHLHLHLHLHLHPRDTFWSRAKRQSQGSALTRTRPTRRDSARDSDPAGGGRTKEWVCGARRRLSVSGGGLEWILVGGCERDGMGGIGRCLAFGVWRLAHAFSWDHLRTASSAPLRRSRRSRRSRGSDDPVRGSVKVGRDAFPPS